MSNSEPSRALIAYAALAHRLTAGGDVVQALMSFFRPIADEFAGELFNPDEFCARVSQLYGLSVPRLAALGWCERLAEEQLLEVHSRTGPSTVYRWRGRQGGLMDDQVVVFQEKVDLLLDRFKTLCESRLSPDALALVHGRYEGELFDRLLKLDSMRLLLRKDNASSIKTSAKTLSIKPTQPSFEERVALQLDYTVADFILGLRDSSEDEFNLISSILFANMAAEAVSTFREPIKDGALNGIRIYLDTPLILDMFKVNSGFENYSDELWSLLTRSGAQIKVFDHTVQESESVISARLAGIRSGNTPYTHSATAGLRTETLSLLDRRVAQNLEARGVVVERDPETSLLKISARALGTVQSELDRKMSGWKREAKHFDEKTVLSVISIRSHMRVETAFSKAGAVLLTRNTPLVSIANTAWRSWLDEATTESKSRISRSAPIAISDKQFAGLVWLIGGPENAAPLSRARMVAHCAAAIRPRADVVARACNLVLEVHGNEEGEKFAALMVSDRAEQVVMRLASGDPDMVTKERLPEIYRKAMLAAGEVAAEEERAKAELEKQEIRQQHDATLAQRDFEFQQRAKESELERAQVTLELEAARNEAKALRMSEKAKEIRELSNKIETYKRAFGDGRKAFQASRWLVGLIYTLAFLLISQAVTDNQLIAGVVSPILTWGGFWWVPDTLFNPVCNRIALFYFSASVRRDLGASSEPFAPIFSSGTFSELDTLVARRESEEVELEKLRRGEQPLLA